MEPTGSYGMPVLAQAASPSPARIKARLTDLSKPRMMTASVPAALKLPQELFAVATSRASLQDTSLLKAVDELQHAVRHAHTPDVAITAWVC